MGTTFSQTRTEWVTPTEAARRVHVSAMTMWRWVQAGHVPSQALPNGRRRIRLDDLRPWLDDDAV